MNNIEVVKARLEHIDGIMNVENLSFHIPWSKQSLIDEIAKNDLAFYLCAFLNGVIVGYAGMWQIFDEGHITNIAVHPEYRQEGIGSELLKNLIIHARNLGIKRMTLEVRKSNNPAQSLYRKYNFKDGGFRKAYYSDNNEDALIMWLEDI